MYLEKTQFDVIDKALTRLSRWTLTDCINQVYRYQQRGYRPPKSTTKLVYFHGDFRDGDYISFYFEQDFRYALIWSWDEYPGNKKGYIHQPKGAFYYSTLSPYNIIIGSAHIINLAATKEQAGQILYNYLAEVFPKEYHLWDKYRIKTEIETDSSINKPLF